MHVFNVYVTNKSLRVNDFDPVPSGAVLHYYRVVADTSRDARLMACMMHCAKSNAMHLILPELNARFYDYAMDHTGVKHAEDKGFGEKVLEPLADAFRETNATGEWERNRGGPGGYAIGHCLSRAREVVVNFARSLDPMTAKDRLQQSEERRDLSPPPEGIAFLNEAAVKKAEL